MYKLAIIDDEPLIQLGLHSLVHYGELSLVPCDFVNTGSDALALIKSQRPDIVLLDIAMPNVDGIDIMQRVQDEAGYSPVFLILTNYNDFSYARTALRLGAVDFITKIEVNETVLNSALQKAILKIPRQTSVFKETPVFNGMSALEKSSALTINDTENGGSRNFFFDKLLNRCFQDPSEINLREELTKYGISGSLYGAVCFRLGDLLQEENNIRITAAAAELIRDCMKKHISSHASLWEADSIVCILALPDVPDSDSLLKQALSFTSLMVHRYTNKKAQIGVGSFSEDPYTIPSSFAESCILCRRAEPGGEPVCFTAGEELTAPKETAEEFHLCEYRDGLMDAFSANDSQSIARILNQISSQYLRPGDALHKMLSVCFSLFHFISTQVPDTGTCMPSLFGKYRDPVESIRNIRTQQEVEEWVCKLRDALCDYLDENLIRSRNYLVSSIIDYIDQHAGESLSLQKVADAFDKSPTYISSLFKKYSNIGFAEHVRNAKLAKAKELLAEGYKVRDVADMLEYSDPYYFSKVFKKAENMSPAEYAYSLHTGQADTNWKNSPS